MTLTVDDYLPDLTRQQVAEMTRLIGELDDFKGHWRRVAEVRAEKLAQLRQVTTIESTASSTRIEGVELSDTEVARVLEGVHVDSFRARDEAEVLGYGELLNLIFESHSAIALTENHVKQLHGTLLRHSEKDERHRGRYKTLDNHVVAKHPDGTEEIIFRTTSPFDTPRRMTELVTTTNAALEERQVHALVVIARFVVAFLAVHPFQDGNGRLSRALTTLLLLQSGYDYVPYSSLERIIEENKTQYYAALRTSQVAMRDVAADFGEWLIFFLRALRAQKASLESKLEVETSMLHLSGVQEQIVDFVRTSGRGTSTNIGEKLGVPYRTVRYHLDILVGRHILEAHGEKKGRYYTISTKESADLLPTSATSTNAIIADIYESGGRIGAEDLRALVKRHAYDPRSVGILHGRRAPHLRRDPKTGDSLLTSRGEEIARQHLFTTRLTRQTPHIDDIGSEDQQP
jgi:Fic family protein